MAVYPGSYWEPNVAITQKVTKEVGWEDAREEVKKLVVDHTHPSPVSTITVLLILERAISFSTPTLHTHTSANMQLSVVGVRFRVLQYAVCSMPCNIPWEVLALQGSVLWQLQHLTKAREMHLAVLYTDVERMAIWQALRNLSTRLSNPELLLTVCGYEQIHSTPAWGVAEWSRHPLHTGTWIKCNRGRASPSGAWRLGWWDRTFSPERSCIC